MTEQPLPADRQIGYDTNRKPGRAFWAVPASCCSTTSCFHRAPEKGEQTMTGSGYALYTEDSDSYKVPLYEEKAGMTPLFYEYIQQNHESSYEVPWSVWLEEQEAQFPAA